MSKVVKILKKGIKYLAYTFTPIAVGSYAYLQYVNSQIGPIGIDKQSALEFYKKELGMQDFESQKTYYWVLFSISLARITSFGTYKRSCQRLASKIIEPTIANYEKSGVLKQITADNQKGGKISKATFNKIVDIRKLNTDNIQLREYIIKQIKTLQKEMNSNLLVGISEEQSGKVNSIHQYICEAGRVFRDREILRYISKLPEIQRKYPGDYLHKILFI